MSRQLRSIPWFTQSRHAHRALIFALTIGGLAPCAAATIYVTSTSGAKNVATSCVIRDAITAANTHAAVGGCAAGSATGSNVIELPPGGALISLTAADNIDPSVPSFGANGLPVVISPITIHGNGAIIERSLAVPCNLNGQLDAGEFRLMQVQVGGSFELDDITLRNGCADGDSSGGNGDSLSFGGILVLANSSTAVLLRRVRMTNNSANLGSGAIGQISQDPNTQGAGTLDIAYSTIDHNYAGFGPTITALNPDSLSNCTTATSVNFRLFNSTVSDNGVGVLPTIFGCGTARIEASTITANQGSPAFQFSAPTGAMAAIQIKNSIIAGNTGGDCSLNNDASLSVTGANLSSDASCPNFTYINTAPKLAPLGNYGGPTPTHEPLPASMAIDAVTDCTRVDMTTITDDQRGITRPLLGRFGDPLRCDIGAVEYNNDLNFADGFD